jgi:4-aminobutyrate aminotransferase/(S)-3-amino-2-methylpropionate transaminase
VIEILQRDNMAEQVALKGEYLSDGLEDLKRRHRLIGHYDCMGLYAGIELVLDRKTKEPAKQETALVSSECLKEGLIFITSGYYSNRLAFAPPLVISREEIKQGLDILDRVLTRIEKE